jgi:hypoxanthine-guanine phosphoribosyltransferase
MPSPDVLLTEEQIRNRVTEMGAQISQQAENHGRPLFVTAIL